MPRLAAVAPPPSVNRMASRSDSQPLRYRRLRPPEGDGEVLFDPLRGETEQAIADNVCGAAQRTGSLGDRPWQDWVEAARADLLNAALTYTRRYAGESLAHSPPDSSQRIYLVGHQPELVHPGVWLKNFVLDALAKRDGATAVHVLIDNDTAGEAAIEVPGGTVQSPSLQSIGLDLPQGDKQGLPWEEQLLQDEEYFGASGGRIASSLAELIEQPIAQSLNWNIADSVESPVRLGEQLARMRHELELQWGLRILEVPLSRLCQTESFRAFCAEALAQLGHLHDVYNATLGEYRRVHRLRTRSHPVPDLQRQGSLLETPFWVWTKENPVRRRLWARTDGDAMELTDVEGLSRRLANPQRSFANCFRQLAELEQEGIKIRPRALMTTMYLRVFLCDYFIHGIGGAKYDQITDVLIRSVFGFSAPSYLTVTGTRRLPIPRCDPPADIAEFKRRLRDIAFHPERYLPADNPPSTKAKIDALVTEKQQATSGASDINPKERHEIVHRVNEALQTYVSSTKQSLQQQCERAEIAAQAEKILGARDYSFCLFPQDSLRSWLLDAARGAI